MKTIAFVVAGLVFLLLLVPAGSADIQVTPKHHVGCLSLAQQAILLNVLIARGTPPQQAFDLVQNATAVTGGKHEKLEFRIEEDRPGEIQPCFIVVVLGDLDASDGIETMKGDGSFRCCGTPIAADPVGTILLFEGTPSVNDPMKLLLTINL
jgi:hypothetical protein